MEANHSSLMCIFTFLAIEIYASRTANQMKKVTDPNVRLMPTETPVPVISKLGCAARCFRSNVTRSSFNYNSRTKLCTMGSWLYNSQLPREPGDKLYYENTLCKQYVDFKQYSSASVSSCLWISCTKLNYTDARKFCQDYNSTLYTMKVSEKITILYETFKALYPSSINTNTWSWIGLNNIENPSSYVWEDDGTKLNMYSPYKSELFHSGQPNAQNTESCMSFDTKEFYPLHDYICDMPLIFVCEKDRRLTCI